MCFVKALRNFLRGPEDNDTLRTELYALADSRLISRAQARLTTYYLQVTSDTHH